MAITKSSVLVLASTSATAGSTKASPGATGSWIACSGYYGGDIGISITNGASAPGAALTALIQVSPDNGTTVFDYYPVAGDVAASSVNTYTIKLDQGIMYMRVIGYGNTTNAVTVAASLQAITGI